LAGDHLTILIFSKDSSKVKRYQIPKVVLGVFLIVFPLMIVLATLLGIHYVRNPEDVTLISQFQEKNRIHRQGIRRFSEEIASLQNQIAEMKEFDSKLRGIANLENRPSSLFGVGGPLLEDLREKMRNQQNPKSQQRSMGPGSISSVSEADAPESDREQSEGLLNRAGNPFPHAPSVWPTKGWIIGEFGSPISPMTGHLKIHQGLEISNSSGTPVVAAAAGLVATLGTDPDHGKMIVLSHGHGIVTRYGHLSEIDVEIGQRVERGQEIGKMGNTGRSLGPQVYYEVRANGVPIDPKRFLQD
jgi:murein DD-endopeptidase MepM/ murein hydrolase activator NlpD